MIRTLFSFIKRQRIYVIIALFLLAVQLVFTYSERKFQPKSSPKAESSRLSILEDDLKIREKLLESLSKKENSFAVRMIFFFIIGTVLSFLFGLGLLIYCMGQKMSGKRLIRPFIEDNETPAWGVGDILKIAVLFLFFGYSIHIVEAFSFWLFRIKVFDGNLFALINTALVDIILIFVILYFVRVKYKHTLRALGITVKNFLKAVLTGIVGYISFIPILIFVFILVIIFVNLFHYKPQPQPIFEIFFEEKRTMVLTYLIVLISIIGPIAEEIFFRGFAYGALKKKWGALTSALITSAVFASLHANIVGFFPIMVLGLLLVYLYEKSGSLIPSITVHVIHNAILAVFMLAIKELAGML
ncbi:MAG: CPBP family intramembrane glutamic endopeptidase [Candidatus Omnitrophota bacterium]